MAAWERKGRSLCGVVEWGRVQGHKGYRPPVSVSMVIGIVWIGIQGLLYDKIIPTTGKCPQTNQWRMWTPSHRSRAVGSPSE